MGGRTHKVLLLGLKIDMALPLIPSSDSKILNRLAFPLGMPASPI